MEQETQNQNKEPRGCEASELSGLVDPLVVRGIKLSGDYFADCNLLLGIIEQDNEYMAEAAKTITELCNCFGIPLPEDTLKRLGT
jgi:hypothetical protein